MTFEEKIKNKFFESDIVMLLKSYIEDEKIFGLVSEDFQRINIMLNELEKRKFKIKDTEILNWLKRNEKYLCQ